MNVSFSHVQHAIYTLFKLTVCMGPQFFLFPFERPLRRALLYCTSSPVYVVNICSEKDFALCTFDS